jgi:hypothetical protein
MLGLDPVIDKQQRVVIQSRAALKSAPSLRPGLAMMDGCVCGNPEALSIRDAWKCNHPIKTVSRDEFAAMVERGTVTFGC